VQPTWIVPVQQAQTVMAVTALSSPAAPATCEWTEHTSPEGYKYYYNINTGESKVPFPLVVIVFRRKQSNIYSTISIACQFCKFNVSMKADIYFNFVMMSGSGRSQMS
jgi:hypothetical protein